MRAGRKHPHDHAPIRKQPGIQAARRPTQVSPTRGKSRAAVCVASYAERVAACSTGKGSRLPGARAYRRARKVVGSMSSRFVKYSISAGKKRDSFSPYRDRRSPPENRYNPPRLRRDASSASFDRGPSFVDRELGPRKDRPLARLPHAPRLCRRRSRGLWFSGEARRIYLAFEQRSDALADGKNRSAGRGFVVTHSLI